MKEKHYFIARIYKPKKVGSFYKNYGVHEVLNMAEKREYNIDWTTLDLKYKNETKTISIERKRVDELIHPNKSTIISKRYKDGSTNSDDEFFIKTCYRYLRRYYPEELL